MKFPSSDTLAKIAVVYGLCATAFFYGFFTSSYDLFPNSLLKTAARQASQFLEITGMGSDAKPHFVTERVYEWEGARVHEPEQMAEGLTLIAAHWRDFEWDPGYRLITHSGETVHEWRVRTTELFPDPPDDRVRRTAEQAWASEPYLFPNGDLLANLGHLGVARINACGRPIWTLPIGTQHSLTRADDGTLWSPAGSWTAPDEGFASTAGFPGLESDLYYDRIIQFTGSGEVLTELDVLSLLYENNLQRYIPKGSYTPSRVTKSGDVVHLNDVEPLSPSLASDYPLFESGDLLVSLHHLDLVLVLDPSSRTVKWHFSKPFVQQHDPDFLGAGWIGVFDNNRDGTERGTMSGGSRMIAVKPGTDSTALLFQGSVEAPFYTEIMGRWQRLNNGNLLLVESSVGRVLEVSAAGSVLCEWTSDSYSDETVSEITDANRYDLTTQDLSSWPCSKLSGRNDPASTLPPVGSERNSVPLAMSSVGIDACCGEGQPKEAQ